MNVRGRTFRAAVLMVASCAAMLPQGSWAAESTAYTYDALGRLKSAVDTSGAEVRYDYDAAGNRISLSGKKGLRAFDDALSTGLNQAATFNPRDNDFGDAIAITAKTNGAHGTVTIGSGGSSLTYTPTTGYTGSDSFTYTITDSYARTATATVAMTVVVTNHNPVAVSDSISTTVNTAKVFDPRTNDTDQDGDTLSISAKTDGGHGVVTITGGTSLTYTPTTNYVGSDSFTYTLSDGHGGTAVGTVSVSVASPITLLNPTYYVNKNTTTTVPRSALGTASDSATLTITSVSAGTIISSGASFTYSPGSVPNCEVDERIISYTLQHPSGYTATGSVTFWVSGTVPPIGCGNQ